MSNNLMNAIVHIVMVYSTSNNLSLTDVKDIYSYGIFGQSNISLMNMITQCINGTGKGEN